MGTSRVLIVDDEADIRELLVLTLMRMGLETDTAATLDQARDRLTSGRYDLCLTDMRLPDGEGLALINFVAAAEYDMPVAVITAFGSTENAVAALKAGAFDYLSKPIQLKQLRDLVVSALGLPQRSLDRGRRSGLPSVKPIDVATQEPQLIGESVLIKKALELIGKLSRSQAPVHITGESGTGKEVAARMIHQGSARRAKGFVAVNCGAIPEQLMESEFFGYRKGAFTGADADKDGFLHAADGGTLFLDEVGDLPLLMQVKLLRVIQEKRVRRLGDTVEYPVDFRIISATHRKLAEKVSVGEFRQDLYYRLNVIELSMPSLRQVPEDIPLLVNRLLARLAYQAQVAVPEMAEDAMSALLGYDFPGNVRELENILERALALSSGNAIHAEDLYLDDTKTTHALGMVTENSDTLPLHDLLDQIERQQILKALAATQSNKTAAAKLLGISFRSLRYRLDRLGIQ